MSKRDHWILCNCVPRKLRHKKSVVQFLNEMCRHYGPITHSVNDFERRMKGECHNKTQWFVAVPKLTYTNNDCISIISCSLPFEFFSFASNISRAASSNLYCLSVLEIAFTFIVTKSDNFWSFCLFMQWGTAVLRSKSWKRLAFC